MKKIILLILAVFYSCSESSTKTEVSSIDTNKLNSNLKFTKDDKLREKFAIAFSRALHENVALRLLIKNESLKQFNKDYDVLYQLVKNKPVVDIKTGKPSLNTNSSFRNVILKYFKTENELLEIENQLPLLTIFVPKLPENSFSAENWDVYDTENSPAVAISMDVDNNVPVILNTGMQLILNADEIPNFPVIVLKNNERLISNQMSGYNTLNTKVINTDSNLSFKFIDDNLDPTKVLADPKFINNFKSVATKIAYNNKSITNKLSNTTSDFLFIPGRELTVAPFLVNAYNAFNGQVNNPWQRDNIYYGLTSIKTSGVLSNKYRESITFMKFEGTPQEVYNTLSQRQPGNPDPSLNTNSVLAKVPGPAWTEGNYEFRVWCTHGSKTNTSGTNTFRVLTVSPSELFKVTYTSTSIRLLFATFYLWKASLNEVKPINFYPNGFNGQHLRFFDWDLSDYANNFTYQFEEIDIAITNERTESQTTRHNLNAELNLSTGEKTKLGFKLGSTIEETNTSIRRWNWTSGSKNDLGSQSVYFKDNVLNLNPNDNKYYPNVFNTGVVTFEVRPVQVNF